MVLKTFDVEDLYNEISDLARDQGVSSKAGWDELVDEVIEDHLDIGEIDLEQDTETMKETLRDQWAIYKEESVVSGTATTDDEAVDSEHEENDEVVGPGAGADDDEDEEDDDDDYGDGKELL